MYVLLCVCVKTMNRDSISLAKLDFHSIFLSAPLVMDENKWDEISDVQTEYLDSARSEITDDTDISFVTVSQKGS